MCNRVWRLAAGLAALALAFAGQAASASAHPLDPLSAQEIERAVALLRHAGDADAATRFALIDLDEPGKAAVLAWRPGRRSTRRAFVITRRRRTVYEAVVNLTAGKVESWRAVPGVQSAVTGAEWKRAQQITIADAGWRAAMRKRGYTAFDKLHCTPLAAGYLGDPSEKGRRLVRVVCFDTADTSDVWSRPIEGLVAVVDLDRGKVIRLIDSGPVPVSGAAPDFGARRYPVPRRPPRHSGVGAGYTIQGHRLRWRHWSLHYRMDPRAGLILSLVRFREGGRRRMVLYRGSVAEMFVPYMDPAPGWSFRNWLDVGEYGFGRLASPLVAGTDCPADALMRDAVLVDAKGRPYQARSVLCVFVRHTDAPLWRHAESANRTYAGRPASELVLRTIPSVGDYDYVIDWVLTEAGAIRVDVGATGIDAVKGVRSRRMSDSTAARDTAYGTLVAPNLVAVNHDHFLSLRLDLDIDGAANTLVRRRLVPRHLAGTTGRRSLWTVVRNPVTREGPLSGAGPGGAVFWRIVNPNRTNRLGQHPGYALHLGDTATSLLSADDYPQPRAAFSAAPLWVTAYDPHELYAAGRYPNQSTGGDGLPAYVAHDRPVENADIVLWCTLGFHHLPRPEDWLVMTTEWRSLSLEPSGFFTRNPSLLPRHTAGGGEPRSRHRDLR